MTDNKPHVPSADRANQVCVELFGISRQKAGVAEVFLAPGRLDDVLERLCIRFPKLSESCIVNGRLNMGYLANINGERFVSETNTKIEPGDCLLIFSADAGG